ncbi:MAG: hypothetical protein EBT21_02845 [Actinobacteria bacterium]|nr:hypothetical protein [Actinomycetota bacterium]
MSEINFKKWFDRMQPQTLQIATWLLYFDGFFALVDLLDGGGEMYYLRLRYTGGLLIGLVVIALFISFAFNVALLALLLHRQSKEHQRIWFR